MANYLIDSHIFIWADSQEHIHKIHPKFRELIDNQENDIYLSMASLWEIQIKIMLGKLQLTNSLTDTIALFKQQNMFKILPIKETHILELENLPPIHKDPFDRMLIAQAINEGLILITDDGKITQYPIKHLEA